MPTETIPNRTDKRTYEDVAIKIIDIETYDGDINDIMAELSVLQLCGSQHITFYHGSYLVNTELWIVMEYLGGGSVKALVLTREFFLSTPPHLCTRSVHSLYSRHLASSSGVCSMHISV